jgi:hypothetical protein
MAFKAIFKVEDKEYRVLNCNFSLKQECDKTGRPSSTTRGQGVELTIESTDDTTIFEWMCDSYMRKDATLTFNKRDEEARMKDLEINEAYVTEYKETFDDTGAGAMTTTFKLSAHSIKMGEGEHVNEWAI